MTERGDHSRVLKIGIAGLGFGLDVHLPAFRSISNVEVVGLLGRDPDRAVSVQKKTGVPVSTDLEAWLDFPFDAVSLALPPNEIERVAVAALDRGFAVLAEKPLAPDYGAAKSLADQAGDQPNAVDFEFAELETFIALRDVIHGGVIGHVRHADVVWLMESRALRNKEWSWKTDAARHGGALTLLGTHVFYLLEQLLGPAEKLSARLVSRVTALFAPVGNVRPAEDLAHMLLEHRNGSVSAVVIGNANPGLALHRWTIVGDRGYAVLDNASGGSVTSFTLDVFDSNGQRIRHVVEPQENGDNRIAPFRRLAARFVDAIRTGERCRPDFSDGARVAALVETARLSAAAGAWASVMGPK